LRSPGRGDQRTVKAAVIAAEGGGGRQTGAAVRTLHQV
jgi:hypothetical protein